MKKILAMLLSVAIIATIAISGTIAYLSDTDEATNVASLGSVFVTQYEKERTKDDDSTNALQDFTQYQQIVPAVIPTPAVGTSAAPATLIGVADTTVNMPNHIENFKDKIVYAKNDGETPAYMRTFIAVPAGSYDATSADSGWLHLKLNSNTNNGTTISGNEWTMPTTKKTATLKNSSNEDASYDIYTVTYRDPIEAGKYAVPSLLGFYVDSKVNNEKDEDGKVYYTFGDKKIDLNMLEIKVMTQAVQSTGFHDATTALNAAFTGELSTNPWANDAGTDSPVTAVGTAEELKAALTTFAGTQGSSNRTFVLTANKTYKIEGNWEPVSLDPYVNGGQITIEGNGATIQGLNNSLVVGGIGTKGVIIRNLTIDNTNTTSMTAPKSSDTLGFGAFISNGQAMDMTLENCHLKNTEIISTGNVRVGGLIGYCSQVASGNPTITIKNCSVTGCKITAAGSVGAIFGHEDGADSTVNISGCSVANCELISTDTGDWRVGAIIGTVAGKTTITNCTVDNATTVKQDSANNSTSIDLNAANRKLYGRKTSNGSLTIDGSVI